MLVRHTLAARDNGKDLYARALEDKEIPVDVLYSRANFAVNRAAERIGRCRGLDLCR